MTDKQEFRDTLSRLELSQRQAAHVLNVGERTVRFWCQDDDRPVHGSALQLLWVYEQFPEVLAAAKDKAEAEADARRSAEAAAEV